MTPLLLAIVDRTAYFTHGVERELPAGVRANEHPANDETRGPFPKWIVVVGTSDERYGLLLTIGNTLREFDEAMRYLTKRRP